MNRAWVPPPEGFAKVNLFVKVPEAPLANGNENGVGIVIRDHQGLLIWGSMGPVHGLTPFQVQLWTVHTGMKEAYARGYNDVHIETKHEKSFRILKRQNFEEAVREDLVKPNQAINACNPILPSDHEPICRVYVIEEECNQVARFAANFGMLNHSSPVELDYSFIPLRDLLDIDIRWGPHLPALEMLPNFGGGEVVQEAKPKKRKRVVLDEKDYGALIKVSERVPTPSLIIPLIV